MVTESTAPAAGGMTTIPGFSLSTAEPSGSQFGETPLRDFWADASGYEVKGGVSGRGNPWQRVTFKFNEVDPIETDGSVYAFPTAEFSVFYSDPAKAPKRAAGRGINEWEALCESVRNFLGDQENAIVTLFGSEAIGDGTAPSQMGKRIRMKRLPTLLNVPPNDTNTKYHDEIAFAWQVVEVQGMTPATPTNVNFTGDLTGVTGGASNGATPSPATPQDNGFDVQALLLETADGKTQEAFYEAALGDPRILATPSAVNSLTDRTYINTMKTMKLLTEDAEGVLHKA